MIPSTSAQNIQNDLKDNFNLEKVEEKFSQVL